MRHIHVIGKQKPVAASAGVDKSLSCTLCTLKNGGDDLPCVSSGKCELPSRE